MRQEPTTAGRPRGLDPARLRRACADAAAAAHFATDPQEGVSSALARLDEELDGALVAVLAIEHGLLWVVGACGWAMLSDGLDEQVGVVGRAVSEGEPQLVLDVAEDPDFISLSRGVVSEVAVPLRHDGRVVGVLNVETLDRLPADTVELLGALPEALAPHVATLRYGNTPDLASLARFFVYVSSLRDPRAIAEVVVRAVARILSLETCQISLLGDGLTPVEAAWQMPGSSPLLSPGALAALRAHSGTTVVLDTIDAEAIDLPEHDVPAEGTMVVMPLRAAREELGVLVGTSSARLAPDPLHADAAALVVAHAAASIDAALALTRERRTALTDPLTGLLNRRGLEEVLELQLERAQDRRLPLSVAVLDCDDLKDLNDRAGHEFGDAALREIGLVLPEAAGPSAHVARVGGDEFAVLIPDEDADTVDERSEAVRRRLVEGLVEAGFAVQLSVGVATYPYDGASASQLMRAADQALYEAKASGKDRSVSFRSLVRRSAAGTPVPRQGRHDRHGAGVGAKVLSEALAAADAIWEEETVDRVLERLAKSITFVLGGAACMISRVEGDKLYDFCKHTLRDIDLGDDASYLIEDFPITAEVLSTGVSKAISFLDEDLDRGEAFVLREVRMNCCLLIALTVGGASWGLVEVYDMRMRRFEDDQLAAAEFLVRHAGRRLESLDNDVRKRRGPLFRVPSA